MLITSQIEEESQQQTGQTQRKSLEKGNERNESKSPLFQDVLENDDHPLASFLPGQKRQIICTLQTYSQKIIVIIKSSKQLSITKIKL